MEFFHRNSLIPILSQIIRHAVARYPRARRRPVAFELFAACKSSACATSSGDIEIFHVSWWGKEKFRV